MCERIFVINKKTPSLLFKKAWGFKKDYLY